MWKRLGCVAGFIALVIGLVLLAGLGFIAPVELLFNLAFGWILFLKRVVPQIHIDGSGVFTAAVCLGALALGLQWLLRWPGRRIGVVLGLIVLMFVAGIAFVGIGHQIGWLVASPEPILEGGIRSAAYRSHSLNNLKQIAVALDNYHSVEKTLPPAAIWDRQGQPLLSWRVLILPYVEQQRLYKEFHLDEPWDSPHNLRLLPRMPRCYATPADTWNATAYRTPYQIFVGKGAAFEGKRGLRMPEDFPDGTANTLLVIEAVELVPWTKPADLPFDPNRPLPAMGWLSRQELLAAMADGSVRRIGRQMSEPTLRAAITRNGGETLGPDW